MVVGSSTVHSEKAEELEPGEPVACVVKPHQGHHVSGRCHLPWSAPSQTLVLPFLVYSGKPAL